MKRKLVDKLSNHRLRQIIDAVGNIPGGSTHSLWTWFDSTDDWFYHHNRFEYMGSGKSYQEGSSIVVYYDDAACVIASLAIARSMAGT